MRMLIKVAMPNEGGNEAMKTGAIATIIGGFLEQHRPEAAYFITEGGERVALFVVDVKDSSDLPVLTEPFFHGINARVTMTPAMNAQDLKAGLDRVRL
jgi:hypothetical protein